MGSPAYGSAGGVRTWMSPAGEKLGLFLLVVGPSVAGPKHWTSVSKTTSSGTCVMMLGDDSSGGECEIEKKY